MLSCFCTHAQNSVYPKLDVKANKKFTKDEDGSLLCLDNFYQDRSGKLWFTTCGLTQIKYGSFLSFDGYNFVAPQAFHPKLEGLEQEVIGIVDNRLYGNSIRNDVALLWYYDIDVNKYVVYDQLPLNVNKAGTLKKDRFSSDVIQLIFDKSIYTYQITAQSVIQLSVYSQDLQKSVYPEFDLSGMAYSKTHIKYKEKLFLLDTVTNKLSSISLETTQKQSLKTGLNHKRIYKPYPTRRTNRHSSIITTVPDTRLFKTLFFDLENNLNYVDEVITPTYFGVFFVDSKNNYIKIDELNKSYLLYHKEGNTIYNLEDIFQTIDATKIKNIKGDNFLTELNILTIDGFFTFSLLKPKEIKTVKTQNPIRGIEVLDNSRFTYLLETGKNYSRVFNHVTLQDDIDNQGFCNFNGIKFNQKENQLVGVSEGNIAIYDKTLHTCKIIDVDQYALAVEQDESGNFIYIDNNYKFWKYDLDSSQSSQLKYQKNPIKVNSLYFDFFIDKNNILWVAGTDGLYKYNINNNTYVNLKDTITSFDFKFISLAEGGPDELWLGSLNSGVVVLDTKTNSYKTFSTNEGICNKTIASITKDLQDNFWLGTYNGISVVDKNGQVLINLSKEDGLIDNECNRYSAKLLNDNLIAIGGIKGINLLKPQCILEDLRTNTKFKTYFTSISYFDENSETTKKLSHGFNHINQITLPPGHNNIDLQFATSLYANQSGFAYRIKDVHTDWIDLGTLNTLNLTNLPIGSNTLFIKSRDEKGHWSSNTLKLELEVQDFFYNKVSFYVLIIVALLVITIVTIVLLKKQIRLATRTIAADRQRLEVQALKLAEQDTYKNEFFTNITHEFRTPITIIKGVAQLLYKHPDKISKSNMSLVLENSKDLLSMVNQILDLRKVETNRLKLTLQQSDIIHFMVNIVESHQFYGRQNDIEIVLENNIGTLHMDFDAEKLKIVMSNLISNAIKYSDKKSKVVLSLEKNHDATQLVISLKDEGIGLTEEETERIFELFYQTDSTLYNVSEGSGIGLYYSKILLDIMKGNIEIDSTKNVGTTIIVKLPISHNAAPKTLDWEPQNLPSLAYQDQELRPTKNKVMYNLLIVDDNPSVRALLNSQLSEDYQLTFANDGEEGIKKAIAVNPHLIISDVMMPKKDGFALCNYLKNNISTSHIPIILLTALVSQDSKLKGLKQRADVYLKKPFDFEELKLQVKNLIEGRVKLQEIYKNFNESTTSTTNLPVEDKFILNVREVIISNLSNTEFDVEYLSDTLGISRSGLYKKLKSLTGLSTSAYINYVKLEKAKELLEDSNLNISEISYKLGFTETSNFSRLFKLKYGVSPNHFRKELSFTPNSNLE